MVLVSQSNIGVIESRGTCISGHGTTAGPRNRLAYAVDGKGNFYKLRYCSMSKIEEPLYYGSGVSKKTFLRYHCLVF